MANLWKRLFQVEADLTSNSCEWKLGDAHFLRTCFFLRPLRPASKPASKPSGGSTVLSLSRGPAGNRTTTGSEVSDTRVPRYQVHHEDDSCLEAWHEVFCSNFHGLATLEFKTCIEAMPSTLFHLVNFLFCCNFHQLEAWRLALRPSLCASCGLKL